MALNLHVEEGINNPTFPKNRKQTYVYAVAYGRRYGRRGREHREVFWTEDEARAFVDGLSETSGGVELSREIFSLGHWEKMTPDERRESLNDRKQAQEEYDRKAALEEERCRDLRDEIVRHVRAVLRPEHVTLHTTNRLGDPCRDEITITADCGFSHEVEITVRFPEISGWAGRFKPARFNVRYFLSDLEEDQLAALLPVYDYGFRVVQTINAITDDWPEMWR